MIEILKLTCAVSWYTPFPHFRTCSIEPASACAGVAFIRCIFGAGWVYATSTYSRDTGVWQPCTVCIVRAIWNIDDEMKMDKLQIKERISLILVFFIGIIMYYYEYLKHTHTFPIGETQQTLVTVPPGGTISSTSINLALSCIWNKINSINVCIL